MHIGFLELITPDKHPCGQLRQRLTAPLLVSRFVADLGCLDSFADGFQLANSPACPAARRYQFRAAVGVQAVRSQSVKRWPVVRVPGQNLRQLVR